MNSKLIALAAFATVAVSAHAFTFNFRSTGISVRTGSAFAVNDTNLVGYIGPTPLPAYSFVSLAYNDTANFVGLSMTGTVSGTGTLTIFELSSASNKALTFSFSGAASRVSGTSLDNVAFSNIGITLSGPGLAGTGSFSSNLTAFSAGSIDARSQTTFFSQLNPVPEPASMAVLALGSLGVLRRRRRA